MSADDSSRSADNTAQKQRGRPFEPGESGNPNGRPKGSRNRVSRAVETLIHGQAEALGAKAIDMALKGDASMLRALLGTLVSTRRDRTVEFDLPEIETAADARAASSAVLAACAHGELSPSEASEIMALISTHLQTIEVVELYTKVTAVETRVTAMEKGQQPWGWVYVRFARGSIASRRDYLNPHLPERSLPRNCVCSPTINSTRWWLRTKTNLMS
jgi:hypothetical protein